MKSSSDMRQKQTEQDKQACKHSADSVLSGNTLILHVYF